MGIENDIRSQLLSGKRPPQIIKEGFKKATVYKVYNEFTSSNIISTYSNWIIENIRYNKSKFLPGEKIIITYTLNNISDRDLYLYKYGIQTEWMKNEWICTEKRLLIHPKEKKNFQITCDIPNNLALGDYTLRFGIEGVFLNPLARETAGFQIYWSEPSIIEIKHPFIGQSVFISHSTNDMSLVRELENTLDIYGIEVIIGEDKEEPGVYLKEKFERLIKQSSFFIGLLTIDGLRSKWVIEEVNYALKLNIPKILLVEQGTDVEIPVEYISFLRSESPRNIVTKVIDAINKIQKKRTYSSTSNQGEAFGGILLAALLAGLGGLALGLALGGSK